MVMKVIPPEANEFDPTSRSVSPIETKVSPATDELNSSNGEARKNDMDYRTFAKNDEASL